MTNNKELKDRFIEYFSKLPIQKLAADYIGRSEDTIIDWKKADIEFANRIATAKSEWALDKVGKVRSKEWLLERIMKEQFAQRQELTGKDGESLKPTFVVQTPEAKAQLEKLYEGSNSTDNKGVS